jgi:hypothetical protein
MNSLLFVSEGIEKSINIEATQVEIHVLAYFYHWGREECWNTPCRERGVFVDEIKQQVKAESGSSSSSTSKSKYKESH